MCLGVILEGFAVFSMPLFFLKKDISCERINSVKFDTIAENFQKIEQESSRLAITRILADLLKNATHSEAAIICNISLGQMHPPYISTQFNMAEKSVVKVLVQLMNKSEASIIQCAKKLGDLGFVIEEGDWKVKDGLTVHQVYQALEQIENVSGVGSQEKKARQLLDLLKQLNPIAAKYVIRIILGKLRLGFSDMTIVDALSWMEAGDKSLRPIIENAYNICANIGFIASELKEHGLDVIESMKIHIGIPILLAAAERLPTAEAIMKKIGPTVIAQPKIDGFRLQIHMDKTRKKPIVHFFSRNLQDMTGMFPDLMNAFEQLDVKDIICEGEAVAYDPNTGTFLPFQETVKRKRKYGIAAAVEEFPLQLFIFDILYLNGKSLLNKGYMDRREALLKLFSKFKNPIIRIIEEKVITSSKELLDYFNHNISAGLEGLVVKRPDAVYQPGKRNFNWIKLKRQEEGELADTIDCVILGYYAGSGKRAAFGIGAFLVGVYNKSEDCFETIAKVGTGLKDSDWIELRERCDKIKRTKKLVNVVCSKELYPDVWVEPEIVCLIRADEITASPVHTAGRTDKKEGYALRFPRFMGYRPDKSAYEATAVTEIKRMFKNQFAR
ncbi:ATP-dependent DNA ligase [Candidatus Dependentiae bacterium]|nr:MAG: ATP-dependent DNA ligase [Candidatus Dependentiae bacterium]